MKKKDCKDCEPECEGQVPEVDTQEGTKNKEEIVEESQDSEGGAPSNDPIAIKDKQIAALTGLAKQTQADFINYKNRIDRERVEQMKFASKAVLMKMLNVADNFELSLKHTENHEEFVKGVEFIFSQFFQVLEEEGIKRIDVGDKFDPYKHEALLSEESDKEPNTILEVIQNGYTLHDKVVRNAKVKVAK